MCLSSSLLCVMSKQSLIASFTCKKYLNTIWKTFFLFLQKLWTDGAVFCFSKQYKPIKKKKPCNKESSPQLLHYVTALSLSLSPAPSLPFNFPYVFVLSVFLSLPLSALLSPLVSFCFPLSLSCIDSALLCLRELASKLSAASGLKAISSASLPLQVCGWDW